MKQVAQKKKQKKKKKLKKLEKIGNNAFETKNFKEAVELYGKAIEMAGDRAPATYFSNRAVAWAALGEWHHARDDAEKAMQHPRPANITARMRLQKVHAELMLEEIDAAEQIRALAYPHDLWEEAEGFVVAEQLKQVQHDRASL